MNAALRRHQPPASSQRRGPWAWCFAGALAGMVITSAVLAPARWLAWGIGQATQQRIQLLEAQGTIWRGSAQLVLGADPADASALPGRLAWHLQPLWQGAQVELQAPCCLSAPWTWNLNLLKQNAALDGAGPDKPPTLRLPSAMLAGLGTPWNTIQLQGTLALEADRLSLEWPSGQVTMRGRLQLDALQMRTRLSPLPVVGSYRFQLEGGDVPALALQTLDGALQLQGQGKWTAGRLRFEGEARAAPGREDALNNLLNIIGRRDGARSVIHVG